MRPPLALAAVATALLAPAAPALAGEAMVAVTQGPNPELLRFDAAAPHSPTFRAPLVGLVADEAVDAIDQRPATGAIYLLTSINRMLLLDPATGLLAQPGPPLDVGLFAPGMAVGLDFNPAADRLRLVNVANDELRVDPLTFGPVDGDPGTDGVQGDADVAYIQGDPHAGADPSIVASAFDRDDNDPGTATTLFDIDSALDAVVRQGAVDGNPADDAGGGSPDGGLLTTLGPLGVDSDGTASFDIAGPPGTNGTGWAAIRPVGQPTSTLFVVDVAPGPVAARATPVGPMGAPVAGLAVLRGGAIRAAPPPPAAEGAQAVVRVERTGETLAPVSVSFRTADRTAVAGRDYVPVAGTLDFAQGQRVAPVAIPILTDAAAESTEALALELGAPSGGAVLDTPVISVEIASDVGPASADSTRPGYLQVPRKPRSLAALRRTPVMRVRVGCTEACRIVLSLRLRRVPIGRGRVVLRSAGTAVAAVRLTTAGRRALVAPSKLRGTALLLLRATVTDLAGNVTARLQRIRVSRRG